MSNHPLAAELEQLLLSLLRRPAQQALSESTPLGAIGFDSITLAELAVELQARYGLQLPLPELFVLSFSGLVALAVDAQARAERRDAERAAAPRGTAWLDVEAPATPAPPAPRRAFGLEISLFSFGDLSFSAADAYAHTIEGAKVADRAGLHSIWLPERHFHPFGGISPNPTVLAAALTQVTRRLRLRAGSVILPLHHPVRVAEEWALIDNLSGGRVDLAFGWGWNPNDFVLAPERYEERRSIALSGIEAITRLWRGGRARAENGAGAPTTFELYPRPLQPALQVWLTCTRGPEAFIAAGAAGYNVLTALLFQSVEGLAGNIALYRAARAQNGHDPDAGVVTLMLHTLLGTDEAEVRERVREPFLRYLESSRTLWRQAEQSLATLDEAQRRLTLDNAFERYYHTAALFGTPRSVAPFVRRLVDAGVGELACLTDFGVPLPRALQGMELLAQLRAPSVNQPQAVFDAE
jgi:natural product biosynthesis luciferase-like monooxygenase protein